jgi:Rod binding domain-containing protein
MHHAIHHHHSWKPGAGSGLLSPKPASSEHEQVVEQAQKWVAQTFYGTLLKQVRHSPFHSKLFEGGRGGEAFQGMFDQQLADHMARGTGRKLVNAIARKIEAKKAYGQSPRVPKSKHSYENSPSPLRSIHAATALRA